MQLYYYEVLRERYPLLFVPKRLIFARYFDFTLCTARRVLLFCLAASEYLVFTTTFFTLSPLYGK